MTAPREEAAWPPAWRAVADAIRASIASGQPLNHRREVMRAAGLARGPSCKTGVVDAMIAARALLWMKPAGFGTVTCYRLAHGAEWTPSPPASTEDAMLAAERASVLDHLRAAITDGTNITSFREWVRSTGVVAADRAQTVATAMLRQFVTRETQPGAEGMAAAVRFRITGTDHVSRWAALRPAVRQASHRPLPVSRGKREQSEAELQALIQAHIARHGVTRIQSGSDYPAPVPVRGKVVGDGMVGQGIR